MAFDTTPSKLESVFIQRNKSNEYFEEINVSGSDLIFYHSASGEFTADKISVWATKYGIGTGGGSSESSSWASSSISSSYALSASHAETCDMYVNIDGGTPYSIFGGIPLVILGGGP